MALTFETFVFYLIVFHGKTQRKGETWQAVGEPVQHRFFTAKCAQIAKKTL